MESIINPVEVYADGGTIGKNPSSIGITWAFVIVHKIQGKEKAFECCYGSLPATYFGYPAVSSNLAEYVALARAAKYFSEIYPTHGTNFCSDSGVTMGRVINGWKCDGIPQYLKDQMTLAIETINNANPVSFTLLDGHPTARQLASGIGKRGNPVSRWNVLCDYLCNLASAERTGTIAKQAGRSAINDIIEATGGRFQKAQIIPLH